MRLFLEVKSNEACHIFLRKVSIINSSIFVVTDVTFLYLFFIIAECNQNIYGTRLLDNIRCVSQKALIKLTFQVKLIFEM